MNATEVTSSRRIKFSMQAASRLAIVSRKCGKIVEKNLDAAENHFQAPLVLNNSALFQNETILQVAQFYSKCYAKYFVAFNKVRCAT